MAKPGAAKNVEEKNILIPRLEQAIVAVRLMGMSPLCVHQFGEKAKKEMRDKQQKKARTAREAKVPEDEFNQARYRMEDKADGFPCVTIKKSIVQACRHISDVTMTSALGAFHVNPGQFLVPIEYETGKAYGRDGIEPECREDVVRVGGKGPGTGTADLRYRPEYSPWQIPIEIWFNKNTISVEQIVNLVAHAGFHCGIGENRPAKTGADWGMFRIDEKSVQMVGVDFNEAMKAMKEAAE